MVYVVEDGEYSGVGFVEITKLFAAQNTFAFGTKHFRRVDSVGSLYIPLINLDVTAAKHKCPHPLPFPRHPAVPEACLRERSVIEIWQY